MSPEITTRRAEERIHEAIETLTGGWNCHDMKVFAAPFAEDADFVDVTGAWWRGRREIIAQYVPRHQARYRNSRVSTRSLSIRFVRADVAVVHQEWEMTGDAGPDEEGIPLRRGIMTFCMSEEFGRWRIDAAHNTNRIVA